MESQRKEFYRWWATLTQEQRTSCWYDLDAIARGEVLTNLRAQLSQAQAEIATLRVELENEKAITDEQHATERRICAQHEAEVFRLTAERGEAEEAMTNSGMRYEAEIAALRRCVEAADAVIEGIKSECRDFVEPGPRMAAFDAALSALASPPPSPGEKGK